MDKKIAALILAVIALLGVIVIASNHFQNKEESHRTEFSDNTSSVVSSQAEETSSSEVEVIPVGTILFAGDTMLARTIGEKIEQGVDPFEQVSGQLASADLTVVNLETAVTTSGSPTPGKLFTFNAPVSSLSLLSKHGIDVVSLANNHAGDYGVEGLESMLDLLNEYDLNYIGAGLTLGEAGEPYYFTTGDTDVAIFAYSNVETPYIAATETQPGLNWMSGPDSFSQISIAKQRADVVIVFPHWGYEYQTDHSSEQEVLGHAMIESGADLVIGGHPHVRQDEEEYLHGKIIYSIGNFVFDSMVGPETSRGNLVEVTVSEGEITSIDLVPYTMDTEGFPVLD